MIPGIVEYITLRLVRRFLLTDAFLLRWGHLLPYYQTNANQIDPGPVCDLYADAMQRIGLPAFADRTILEVGSGATDTVGRELIRRGLAGGEGRVIQFEPYVTPIVSSSADCPDEHRLERLRSLDKLASGSIDLVVSHSVLEHVSDPPALFRELARVLAPGGTMIHVVDYRDHFFKYPYHFLLFSRDTWKKWLDPGDLPRWRLPDHLRAMASAGLAATVLGQESAAAQWSTVQAHLDAAFDRNDPGTQVTRATIALRRSA